MYLLSINSDLWKCLPPLVFNISVYFNCTGKLVAAFYIKTNSRLWETIAWKCLFLLEVNFQSHFYFGGLFSGFSFHGLLSQILNRAESCLMLFSQHFIQMWRSSCFPLLLFICLHWRLIFSYHMLRLTPDHVQYHSHFWIIVNFCPGPRPTFTYMYLVKLFIILLPICPALLTQNTFLMFLLFLKSLKFTSWNIGIYSWKEISSYAKKTMIIVSLIVSLILQQGGFSCPWNLWLQDHKTVA